MGQLYIWRYRTTLFAKLADHTYVTCGNLGKAWSCWGGDTGGAILRNGTGSTAQANAIAGAEGKAGITCYLINGVCHQAANRICYPSGITARGARGYALSEARFGTYGRPRGLMGLCKAPFDRHEGVTGDLPECAAMAPDLSTFDQKLIEAAGTDQDSPYQSYLAKVQEIYADAPGGGMIAMEADDARGFQMALFEVMVDFRLPGSAERGNLMEIRNATEQRQIALETEFEQRDRTIASFVDQSHEIDIRFQDDLANALSAADYERLLDQNRDDRVVLGNADIALSDYRGPSFDRQ